MAPTPVLQSFTSLTSSFLLSHFQQYTNMPRYKYHKTFLGSMFSSSNSLVSAFIVNLLETVVCIQCLYLSAGITPLSMPVTTLSPKSTEIILNNVTSLADSNSQLLFLILFQHNNYLLVEDILLTWFLRHQTVYFFLIFHWFLILSYLWQFTSYSRALILERSLGSVLGSLLFLF